MASDAKPPVAFLLHQDPRLLFSNFNGFQRILTGSSFSLESYRLTDWFLYVYIIVVNFMKMQIICTICNDQFDHKSIITVTPCGHAYHESCISQWFKNRSNCPKCRTTVKISNMRKIYFDVDNENNPLVEAFEKKIESLMESLEEKDLIIKLLDEDNKKLQETNESLREEVANQKTHELVYKSTISSLEKKVESFKSKEVLQERFVWNTKIGVDYEVCHD